jgi:hypothetical protein
VLYDARARAAIYAPDDDLLIEAINCEKAADGLCRGAVS